MTYRSAFLAILLVLASSMAGCILAEEDHPRADPARSTVPPRSVPPGVRLTLTYETDGYPDPVLQFQAWTENASGVTLYTRGNCYTPWSWTLTRSGEEVARGPPTATCQPISWAEFPAGSNPTTSSGWNGTEWVKDDKSSDPFEGDYRKAPTGNYVATVSFAFYRTMDPDQYCCPEVVTNEIRFFMH